MYCSVTHFTESALSTTGDDKNWNLSRDGTTGTLQATRYIGYMVLRTQKQMKGMRRGKSASHVKNPRKS